MNFFSLASLTNLSLQHDLNVLLQYLVKYLVPFRLSGQWTVFVPSFIEIYNVVQMVKVRHPFVQVSLHLQYNDEKQNPF